MHLQHLRLKWIPGGGGHKQPGYRRICPMMWKQTLHVCTHVKVQFHVCAHQCKSHLLAWTHAFSRWCLFCTRPGPTRHVHHPRSTFFRPFNCRTSVQRLYWSMSGFLSCPSVALDALASRRGWLTGVGGLKARPADTGWAPIWSQWDLHGFWEMTTTEGFYCGWGRV